MRRAFLLWAPVVAYMALIFFISSLSQAPLPRQVSDKSAHLLGYAALSGLVVRAVHRGLPARVTASGAMTALAITIGYGAFDEFHQWFVPGRSADVRDLAADAAGACLALFVCWAWGILWVRSDA